MAEDTETELAAYQIVWEQAIYGEDIEATVGCVFRGWGFSRISNMNV